MTWSKRTSASVQPKVKLKTSTPAPTNSIAYYSKKRKAPESLRGILLCEMTVGLCKRQFERQFKRHTGVAPVRYFLSLRLALAHKLLQQTDLSVSEVAAASGFRSFGHFSRVYKQQFGRPPSGDRCQALDAPVRRMPGR